MPPWPPALRPRVGEEAPRVGLSHRREAQHPHSPGARERQSPMRCGASPYRRRPLPGGLGSSTRQRRGTTHGSSRPRLRAVLVENSLCWLLGTMDVREILEFDLERQSLAVIQLPANISELDIDYANITVMRAEGGGLGFLFVSYLTAKAQLWKRKIDLDGAVSWGLTRAIELDKLLSLDLNGRSLAILGYAEANNVLLLVSVFGFFTVQLETLQLKRLSKVVNWTYHLPFESVYIAGLGIGGGQGGAEHVHNT